MLEVRVGAHHFFFEFAVNFREGHVVGVVGGFATGDVVTAAVLRLGSLASSPSDHIITHDIQMHITFLSYPLLPSIHIEPVIRAGLLLIRSSPIEPEIARIVTENLVVAFLSPSWTLGKVVVLFFGVFGVHFDDHVILLTFILILIRLRSTDHSLLIHGVQVDFIVIGRIVWIIATSDIIYVNLVVKVLSQI